MTPYKFFEKGAWQGTRDPLKFCALNADNSITVKATDFKFYAELDGEQQPNLYTGKLISGRDQGHVIP